MKKISLLLCLFFARSGLRACTVCEKQQPEILRGITHGTGPENNWDLLIVSAAMGIVLFTLFFSVKWLFFPGEQSETHIKRSIVNNE